MRIHDVIDDVTMSQSRSNFESDIVVYSTFGITSGKKVFRELKMAAILKIFMY